MNAYIFKAQIYDTAESSLVDSRGISTEEIIKLTVSYQFQDKNGVVIYQDAISKDKRVSVTDNLSNNLGHIPPSSWLAKKVFRLTIPVFIKLLKLSPAIIIISQILVGYLTYIVSFKLTLRITKDAIQSTFLTTGIAFLYFGRWSF